MAAVSDIEFQSGTQSSGGFSRLTPNDPIQPVETEWSSGQCDCCADGCYFCLRDYCCQPCDSYYDLSRLIKLNPPPLPASSDWFSCEAKIRSESGHRLCYRFNICICMLFCGLGSLRPIVFIERYYSQRLFNIKSDPWDKVSDRFPPCALMQMRRHFRKLDNEGTFPAPPEAQQMSMA